MSRPKGSKNLSKEFWDTLCEKYVTSGDSIRKVAKKYDVSSSALSYQIKLRNLYRPRTLACQTYPRNSSYFDTWSQNSAYIFGFICADGSLVRDSISIQIHAKDKEVLNFIGQEIYDCEPPIKYREGSDQRGPQVSLIISDQQIAQTLEGMGVVKNKSFDLQFPNCIPNEFMSDFFRGYFDGDGTLGKYGKNHRVSWVSTDEFCRDSLEYVRGQLGIGGFISRRKNHSAAILGGRLQGKKFLEWIYQDASSFKLNRKYQRFLEEFY